MTQISNRLRFGIFTRDGFRCAYCGQTSAEATLHVDHVIPQALGGTDDPTNLVTACSACNQAKSDALIVLPEHIDLTAPLPTYRRRPTRSRSGLSLRSRRGTRLKDERENIWPVAGAPRFSDQDGPTRGWPLPDGAWDQLCVKPHVDGYLPWAIWQIEPDWYLGFYSCDQDHAWTCGHSGTAGLSELLPFRVSPFQRLPDRGYLKINLGVTADQIPFRVIAYPFLEMAR